MGYKLEGRDMLVQDSGVVIHPGSMVRAELAEKGLATEQAALLMGVDPRQLEPALAGRAPFDAPLLDGLGVVFTPGFADLVGGWQAGYEQQAAN